MKILSLFSSVVIACAFLVGCSYNPGVPLVPGKTIPAGAGSTYIYSNTPIDTTGKLLTDSTYFTVDSVAAAGTTYSGKTNVTRFSIRNTKTGVVTLSYINFETNGDISEYVGGSLLSFLGIHLPDWVTYPMQTHTSYGSVIFDTTFNFPVPVVGTVPIHIVVSDSITYQNWDLFSLNNASIPQFNLSHKTNYNGVAKSFVDVSIFNSDALTTLSFAPSLGYYTKRTTQPFKVPLGVFPSLQGSQKILTAYNLK
jgi:hypothetical protein